MPSKAMPEILNLLKEYQFLTPRQVALIRKNREDETAKRGERRNLTLLARAGKVKRTPYYDISNEQGFGGRAYVYHLLEDHSRRTLDHELEITDYHIKLKKFCDEHGFELIWQQKHMAGKFYPDAYFSFNGLHFFLEIERQKYGNVRQGKPSIIRKAESYYAYYNSDECGKRWGFKQFRVIFQLNEIRPDDFLTRLPKHRMFWVGTPDSLAYKTPKDYNAGSYTFLDI